MRANIFTDKALAKHAGRFVWLGIDGEKAVNAEFRRSYKIPGYPTYYVIDPVNGEVLVRWVGSASVAQLDQFFGEQSAAYSARTGGAAGRSDADALLAKADSLYGADQHAAAADAYSRALAAVPPASWPRYARAMEAWLFSLSQADSAEACVTLAEWALAHLGRSIPAANVAASGLGCALELPADSPRRAERIMGLERACKLALADTALALTGDDRSGLYIALMDARSDEGDSLGQKQVAEAWSAFLDREAAKAKSPEARTVFDSHRLSAYIEIGHAERAIPMLEQSARDFPDDYNPPARLANAYRTLGRWDEALAASDLAMSKAYGPRKILFFQNRSDIYKGKGDLDAARRTLDEAIAFAKALPEGQRSNSSIAGLEKRREALK